MWNRYHRRFDPVNVAIFDFEHFGNDGRKLAQHRFTVVVFAPARHLYRFDDAVLVEYGVPL